MAKQETRTQAYEQFEKGISELSKGRLANAINCFEIAAAERHAAAAWALADIYENGHGTETFLNKEKAFQWTKRAADLGHPLAINAMGEKLRDSGLYDEALKYFEKGAKRGWSDSLTNLGLAYKAGVGTSHDLLKAFECFSEADRKGNYSATYMKDAQLSMINSWNLFLCYHDGSVTEKDPEKKYAHCRNAWKLPEAKFAIASMLETGHGVQQNFRDAMKWFALAAEAGCPGAQEKVLELQTQVASDETFSQVQLQVINILRQELTKEFKAGFPMLKRIPRTSIIQLLDYFETLDEAQKSSLVDGIAEFSSFSVLQGQLPQTNRAENWQKHPGLGPYYRAIHYFKKLKGLRYVPILDLTEGRFPADTDRDVTLRNDLNPFKLSAIPAKASLLRAIVDTKMKELFAKSFSVASEKNGNRIYRGIADDEKITVLVQFSPKTVGQLRYQLQIDSAAGINLNWTCLETLWFQSAEKGWDYLTDDNAERCIGVLPELITITISILRQIRELA